MRATAKNVVNQRCGDRSFGYFPRLEAREEIGPHVSNTSFVSPCRKRNNASYCGLQDSMSAIRVGSEYGLTRGILGLYLPVLIVGWRRT